MNPSASAPTFVTQPACRSCGAELNHTFVDLGMSPLCQTHITNEQLNCAETFYPLQAYVCAECFLVQLDEFVAPDDIFSEYAYFSSYSEGWVEHARQYTEAMISRFGLQPNSHVIEIASNDGYLLQHFVNRQIPVLGIEPAANIAKVANEKGIRTLPMFHGKRNAQELVLTEPKADLLLGNNVLAHTPHLNDFVAGLKILLKPNGVITMEFPHLLRLMQENQFDTIYHEHFSYFSFLAVQNVFDRNSLRIFDVHELPTHGGSLRIYAQHANAIHQPVKNSVAALEEMEKDAGLHNMKTYENFCNNVTRTKRQLLQCLIKIKDAGKTVVGYGAPGKGNTLLNYCGIGNDFLDYTVDKNPYKQGKYTPGTHIPILAPDQIDKTRPDYILILPWNLKAEIMKQLAHTKEWGCKFIVPIPEAHIVG